VVKNLKVVMVRNSILQGLEGLVLEFEDLSTINADQVIVMASFSNGLKSRLPVRKLSLGCQSQAGQELHGPVDRCIADLRIYLGYLGVDFSEVLVSGGVEEDVEDLLTLFGRFEFTI
jgi:hypothetical protein